MDDKSDRIRARAHAIWEADGKPGGKDILHWDQATSEIESDPNDIGEVQAESSIEVVQEAKALKQK